MTAAAFRAGLLLGSGFGETKAGGFVFSSGTRGAAQRTAAAGNLTAQLLGARRGAAREGERVAACEVSRVFPFSCQEFSGRASEPCRRVVLPNVASLLTEDYTLPCPLACCCTNGSRIAVIFSC